LPGDAQMVAEHCVFRCERANRKTQLVSHHCDISWQKANEAGLTTLLRVNVLTLLSIISTIKSFDI